MRRIDVIDTHTGGEPTRIVIEGGPDLGDGPLDVRRTLFRTKHDDFRAAVVNEPRGSDVMVGALLGKPTDPSCVASVIFFNNIGTLGMCGHGTMGVAVALAHLGRIRPGSHRLETPVGVVAFDLMGKNHVAFENVPSYRFCKDVVVGWGGGPMDPGESVKGDVAWGGNWFYLVGWHRDGERDPGQPEKPPAWRYCAPGHEEDVKRSNIERLTQLACHIRDGLRWMKITGENGAVMSGRDVDHIELFGPPTLPDTHSKNFVLCPGKAYDRSPCGTGTSAKLACLVADGKLKPGDVWRQESIIGSVFEGSVRLDGDRIIPRIAGTAYVTAEATLLLDPDDPFCMGIPS